MVDGQPDELTSDRLAARVRVSVGVDVGVRPNKTQLSLDIHRHLLFLNFDDHGLKKVKDAGVGRGVKRGEIGCMSCKPTFDGEMWKVITIHRVKQGRAACLCRLMTTLKRI